MNDDHARATESAYATHDLTPPQKVSRETSKEPGRYDTILSRIAYTLAIVTILVAIGGGIVLTHT